MFYVNMNDKALSGWGKAGGGRSLYCIRCKTLAQAEAIEKRAQNRGEMRYIAISDKPRRRRAGDVLTIRDFEELGDDWKRYYNPLNEC